MEIQGVDSILTNDDLLTLWLTAHYGEEVPTAVLKKLVNYT